MKLFAGLSRTDYEDVFRAIGALVDERGWTNVSVMEVEDGIVLQVLVKPSIREPRPKLETYLLTDNDLERVTRDAVLRRRKQAAAPPAVPEPAPAPPVARQSPASPPPPAPSRMVEERIVSMANGRTGRMAAAASASDDEPLPPLPPLDGLPVERGLGGSGASQAAVPVAGASEAYSPAEEEFFAPEPMRLSPAPPPPPIDLGAARAAVVMAHIVAARLKSGMPMTGDDPDLASLLDQVRALDETNIGGG